MAMRPIWSGALSFGLVNIPVKLYLAAKSQRIGFHQLHEKDQARIQMKRFCSEEQVEVPYDEIVKGYEYEKGQYVVIEDKDFDRIEIENPQTVDIQQFVDKDAIDPIYFDTPYYLEPGKGADKAYALLRAALEKSGKVGVATVVLKERSYVAAVHVVGEVVAVSMLRYAADIRDWKELHVPREADLPEKQLDLAMMLVDQLAGEFDISKFTDDYEERIEQMVKDKLAGAPIPKREKPEETGKVVDLVEVLKRSIEHARGPDKHEKEHASKEARAAASGSRRHRAHAARSTRPKKH